MKAKYFCFSRKNSNRLCIILCGAALFSGGIIYILFRPSEVLFLKWLHTTPIYSFIRWIKPEFHLSDLHLPEWIIYSLPNGFWAFAYSVLITVIWYGSHSRQRYFWLATIPVLVYGCELLQFFGIAPGTFCMQDLVLGTIGLLLGNVVGIQIKPENHERESL
jgi:hypothetical protein